MCLNSGTGNWGVPPGSTPIGTGDCQHGVVPTRVVQHAVVSGYYNTGSFNAGQAITGVSTRQCQHGLLNTGDNTAATGDVNTGAFHSGKLQQWRLLARTPVSLYTSNLIIPNSTVATSARSAAPDPSSFRQFPAIP